MDNYVLVNIESFDVDKGAVSSAIKDLIENYLEDNGIDYNNVSVKPAKERYMRVIE